MGGNLVANDGGHVEHAVSGDCIICHDHIVVRCHTASQHGVE